MFLLGAYRLENYDNINSIPDTIKVEQKKKNGIVYVISDTLFSSENFDLSSDVNENFVKLFKSIIKQKSIFNNIEAVVLNGNILNNVFSKHGNVLIDKNDYSYKVLKTLISVSGNIPIYYIRGCFDCYISSQTLPPDLRGVIKICNSCQIGSTLFLHGHNSLPFLTDSNCSLINNIKDKESQFNSCLELSNCLNLNIVISNNLTKSSCKNNIISIGSFVKNGFSVISLNPFGLSSLSQNI